MDTGFVVTEGVWAFTVDSLETRPATAKKRIIIPNANRTFFAQSPFRFMYPILAKLT